MKNLINLFAAIILALNIAHAQMPSNVVETMIAAEQNISAQMQTIVLEHAQADLPVRVINNKNASNIFIQPEVVLSEATLNIVDDEGNAMMAYHFDHLSEIDLSIKRLPVGDYTLKLHSKQGSSSHKVVR